MINLDNVDMEEFVSKIEALDGLVVSKSSIDRSIKAIKEDLANVLGVNKKKVSAILKIFTNLREEGEPFDEELVEGIKALYVAFAEREED